MPAKTNYNLVTFVTATIMTSSLLAMTSYSCPVRECSCEMTINGVSIDCTDKNFDKIPDFETTTEQFHEIKFSGNRIAIVPGKAFKKLSVEKIDLSGNPIRKISPLAFEGLETQLKELTLEAKSETPIKFPTDLLHSLVSLEAVKIKGFDMPVLEHGIFMHSKNLQRLILEDCKIITIFPTAFQGLEDKLTLLDLTDNRLTSVPVVELRSLIHLRKLVLAQNRITTIQHSSFTNLTKLIDLDLSMNSIQKIESSAFSGLELGLEYLGLHANMISQTSLLAIANLAKLEQLNLAYNLFMNSLPDYTFKNLNKLAYLNLQGNRLTSISPATFEGLSESLSVLILSENKLTTLPDEGFRHLENLKWLYLDLMNLGGSLTQHTFHGLENTLEYLTLEGVQFVDGDWPSVHYLKGLKSLNLCQNQLESIPEGTFQSLNKLEQLMMCHNNIQNVTQAAMNGLQASLQLLNLESNNVETIDQCTLRDFKRLTQLNLDGNPLNCDCRLIWLRQWIENQNDITKMMIGWKCAQPTNHVDRLLKHVSITDLTCASHEDITCQEFVKATESPDIPHAHIQSAVVSDDSVSLHWKVDNSDSVVGVRLFYKMTDNETYSYTLLLNPHLREYIIHDLASETNYTICIGLDLKLGRHLPDEECITVTTDRLGAQQTLLTEKPQQLIMIIGSSVGGFVFLTILMLVVFQVCKWRRRTRRAKHGLYDTPWVTARPHAPSLSTLPSRRSDFENPVTHYYSRPLSTGTIHTVSSHLPRSNSMATVLDSEYGRHKRTQSVDQLHPVYDMDRCLYKIDNIMASASNLLVHQPNSFHTSVPLSMPPPYQHDGISPDMPPFPAEVSEYPVQFITCKPRESYSRDSRDSQGYAREPGMPVVNFAPKFINSDYSLKSHPSAHERDSGHMSGFPSYTSGFDELEAPPGEFKLHRQQNPSPPGGQDQNHDEATTRPSIGDNEHHRSGQDPLPPPPAYMLDEAQPEPQYHDDRHIYDEIYTIY